MSKRANGLLLVLAALLAALALLELLMRFLALPAPVVVDPLRGYRRAPGMTNVSTAENDHPVVTVYNRQGYRGADFVKDKAPGVLRVAVLGDSFVEAEAVEEERTFVHLAQELWRERGLGPAEFMNFGVSGYSPAQEYLQLRDEVLDYAPDVVLLFFFPTNDIEALSPKTALSRQQPFASVDAEGRLQLDTGFSRTPVYQAKRALVFLRRHSALVNGLYERLYARILARNAAAFHPEDGLPPYLSLCTATPHPDFVPSYAAAKAILSEAATLCRTHDTRFILVLVNHSGSRPGEAEQLRALDLSLDPLCFEQDLAALAREQGFGFIGLQGLFSGLYATGGGPFHWDHWNYTGHEVVAQLLVQVLAQVLDQDQRPDKAPAEEGEP